MAAIADRLNETSQFEWECDDQLRSSAVVVIQHSARALASMNLPGVFQVVDFWIDQPIGPSLVIAFTVVMRDEVVNCSSERSFTKQDHGAPPLRDTRTVRRRDNRLVYVTHSDDRSRT